MTTTYTAAYAFATSTFADAMGRHKQGCHYVQRTVGHKPGTVHSGPYETKQEAEAAARQAIAIAAL